MKGIPSLIRKKITQESRSACPFCGERRVSTAELHHIIPRSEGGESTEENLIYTCANCHSKITMGEIQAMEVLRVKLRLTKGCHPYADVETDKATNVVHADFTNSINRGVIANEVSKFEMRTSKTRVTINPPSGSIASSLAHKNYIKHLIDRFHEFKKIEVGAGNVNYAILYASIKREFGAKWDMIPLKRFEDLAAYLCKRINSTKHGRIRRARGGKNYSEFSEYERKHVQASDD